MIIVISRLNPGIFLDHPPNVDDESGAAVNVTLIPDAN
jgi:hypothetical protein